MGLLPFFFFFDKKDCDCMLKKIDYAKINIEKNKKYFSCPICYNMMELLDNSLKCSNGHCFDISHKGYLSLIRNNKKRIDKVYNDVLFSNRVKFINCGFYDKLHNLIGDVIKEHHNVSLIVDAGSGDGSHDNKILNLLNNKDIYIFGIDISKHGIQISTDYVNNNFIPIIADLNRLPFNNNTIDVILNILSPSNEQEMNRVLKKDGIIIKVTPKKEYLKELRNAIGADDYENEDIIDQHINNNYLVREKYDIIEKYNLNDEQLNYLINMTPLSKNFNKNVKIKDITIALNVYVLQTKE